MNENERKKNEMLIQYIRAQSFGTIIRTQIQNELFRRTQSLSFS